MRWSRNTQFGEFKPYVREDGLYSVLDLTLSHNSEFETYYYTNCKRSEYWAVVDNKGNIVKAHFTSAKSAKEFASTL